jgi:NADH-quinone oxidoreductase subunit G
VSSWGSNEELAAFKSALSARVDAFVKEDSTPAPGERLDDDLLIRADKNPTTTAARALFAQLPNPAVVPADTDLVLVWGEGFDFARLPPRARIIFLNSYLQPENGHADVFLPVSTQTERHGHYTNFQGTVSAFEPCFVQKPGVQHAEDLIKALAAPARGHP